MYALQGIDRYWKEMFKKVHKKECYIRVSISLQFLQKKVWNFCSIKLVD